MPEHFDERAVVGGLNGLLKTPQITVLTAHQTHSDFHARFDAIERHYLYRILNRRICSALRRDFVWHHPIPLNAQAMNDAAQYLIGRHDFTSFRASSCQANSAIRTLDKLTVTAHDDEIHIEASARSFLHNQIRNFAGSLALIGMGKWTFDDLKAALAACDRKAAGPCAPAKGLTFR